MLPKGKLRKLVVIFIVALGLMIGAPLDPQKVEELLRLATQPKVAHVLRQEKDDDDPLHRLPGAG